MASHNSPLESAELRPMLICDVALAAALIGRAMNEEEQGYAEKVFKEHFESRRLGFDDGRSLFVLTVGEALIGITGLHHYAWGPPENVWLSWFAVDPEYQGRGFGKLLLRRAIDAARSRGFRKMFIETYSSPTFDKARRFYTAQGFNEVGGVRNYLPDGADMVVYGSALRS